jgi:hypothetical protein
MIRQPDRLISKFISSLDHVGQCFIGLYGSLKLANSPTKPTGRKRPYVRDILYLPLFCRTSGPTTPA